MKATKTFNLLLIIYTKCSSYFTITLFCVQSMVSYLHLYGLTPRWIVSLEILDSPVTLAKWFETDSVWVFDFFSVYKNLAAKLEFIDLLHLNRFDWHNAPCTNRTPFVNQKWHFLFTIHDNNGNVGNTFLCSCNKTDTFGWMRSEIWLGKNIFNHFK